VFRQRRYPNGDIEEAEFPVVPQAGFAMKFIVTHLLEAKIFKKNANENESF
jgi:hypothetical protein